MPTIAESIEAALFAHTLTLDVTGDPPLAWPNTTFPEEGEAKPATYVEVIHLPNRNTRYFMNGGDPHLRQGILQLTIFTPLLVGPTPATTLAGEIAEHFPADLALFEDDIKVRIQKAPDIIAADKTDDDVSWSARCDVYYEVYA
jgi:hypothetical protein